MIFENSLSKCIFEQNMSNAPKWSLMDDSRSWVLSLFVVLRDFVWSDAKESVYFQPLCVPLFFFFYRTVCFHARDKKHGLPLRGRPILLSLVWLQTELDSTQSYYSYLVCTQRIRSNLRSTREIWTALMLWKINLRAAKSWFDSPSSEKVKVPPTAFSLLFSPLDYSFRYLSFSLSFKFPARMLIGNFDKSLKNGLKGSL